MLISIIVPCYNEEKNIMTFFHEIKKLQIAGVEFEMIYINDGSKDDSLQVMQALARAHSSVRYLSLSRNFGKEAAMLAGLEYAVGDAAIIMDADLQHPPSLIPTLIKHYQAGYDQVIAKRNRSGESKRRRSLTFVYYKLINRFIDVELIDGVGDFRLLSKRAIDSLLSLKESNRFSKGLFSWIGFETKTIAYDNVSRADGESKWSFSSLFNYGLDGILSFNNKPLRALLYLGMTVTGVALLYIIYTLIEIILHGIDEPGYFTIIAAILLFGGIQLISLGVIGEYIGRIYYETKQRPHYIIEETEKRMTNEKDRDH